MIFITYIKNTSKENEKFEIMDTPDYARNNNWLNILKVLKWE